MRRDLERLAAEPFDLLVVGGGVHGAAVARAGALAGLSTALVERGDFGGATSANSLKIVHGGLRHLQRADLRLVREGVAARRRMMALFPHLVVPLPCVVPTYGLGTRGRLALGVALALNDRLGRDRNQGLPEASRLPPGRILGRAEMLRVAPGIQVAGLTGGALWYDALALDTERLVLDLVLAADARGACAANYVRVEGFLRRGDAVTGVQAVDTVSGEAFDVRARVTLNAAGPWLDLLAAPLRPAAAAAPLTRAVNILVGRPLFGDHAVGLTGSGAAGSGGRSFFFVPWRGGTMIGTLYLPFEGRPEDCAVAPGDIELMVAEINRIHPAAALAPEEVRFAHVGVMPLAPGTAPEAVDAGLLRSPQVIDYARTDGVGGCVGIRSVKYTSACLVADEALRLVLAKLGRAAGQPPPEPGPEAEPEAPAHLVEPDDGAPATLVERLRRTYGARVGPLLELLRRQPHLARRVAREQPTVGAEIVHAARAESALTLADLVLRRTPLGSFGHPGLEALRAVAALAARELGWDDARRAREIELLEAEYARLLGGRR